MRNIETKNNFSLNVNIQVLEKVNPLFSKAKCYVAYYDLNRNFMNISKTTFENAIPSIFNIPVVGEYIEDKQNFTDHAAGIELNGNEIVYTTRTIPYGVVAESANVYWENVTEADGIVREYLVVDGIYLWTSRYSELDSFNDVEFFNQSMEIVLNQADKIIIDGIEYLDVKDFTFSALCILGVNKESDPTGNQEPCFESSKIIMYSLDKDKFKKDFNQMIAEFKFSMNNQEGGNQVTETVTNTVEETIDQVETTETTQTENFEVATITEEVTKTEVETTVTTIETQGNTTVSDIIGVDSSSNTDSNPSDNADQANFVLTASQLKAQIRQTLSQYTYIDKWGDTSRLYWYVDNTDSAVIVENSKEGYTLYQLPYILNGDNVEIQVESAQKIKIEYVPFDEGTTMANFERIEIEKAQFEVEVSELKSFKRIQEEKDLSSQFNNQLTNEELTQVFEASKELSIQEIETKLFALVGKKNFSLNTKKEVETNKTILPPQSTDKEIDPYGGIFN